MNYGKALKFARALAGLQQKELAKLVELDPSHLSLIESGKRNPSVAALEKISEALSIPLHVFTLMAAEPSDLKNAGPDEVRMLGETLAQFLLRPQS
jgi:transcriptional regulator with XRE-family HTH domain